MRKILEHIKESYINKDTKGYRGIVSFGRNVTKRGEMWTLKEGSKDFRVHNHMTQYSPNNQKGCSGSHIKKKKKKKKEKKVSGSHGYGHCGSYLLQCPETKAAN